MDSLSNIYDRDYILWLQETHTLLENHNFQQLDLPHLKEEILNLGNEQRRKVSSYLRQLLIHLLLYRYWETEHDHSTKS